MQRGITSHISDAVLPGVSLVLVKPDKGGGARWRSHTSFTEVPS